MLDLAGRLDAKRLHTHMLVARYPLVVARVPIVATVLHYVIPSEIAETASQSGDGFERYPLWTTLLTVAMSSV